MFRSGMAEKRFVARFIVEMLGFPEEHLKKTMATFVESLKHSLDFSVVSAVVEEPKPVKDAKLFTVFVEIEAKFGDLSGVLDFCFENMPSSVEVVEPAEFAVPIGDVNNFLNDILDKLHKLDMNFKVYRAENKKLNDNAMHVFRNFLLYLVRHGVGKLDELSSHVGVASEELKPFLEKLVSEEKIVLKNKVYVVKV